MGSKKVEIVRTTTWSAGPGCHGAGMGGIKVMEVVQALPNDKHYLGFLPFPTELCILCKPRTRKGLEPACVKQCMAACMKYDRIEDLAKEM